jgi:hypothetical protein
MLARIEAAVGLEDPELVGAEYLADAFARLVTVAGLEQDVPSQRKLETSHESDFRNSDGVCRLQPRGRATSKPQRMVATACNGVFPIP